MFGKIFKNTYSQISGENSVQISGKNNSITINGKTYTGSNIIISDGEVFIDGVKQEDSVNPEDKIINITVEGNVETVKSVSGDITVHGSAKFVQTTSGDIDIDSSVEYARTVSGDITAKSITHASSVSGNIYTK